MTIPPHDFERASTFNLQNVLLPWSLMLLCIFFADLHLFRRFFSPLYIAVLKHLLSHLDLEVSWHISECQTYFLHVSLGILTVPQTQQEQIWCYVYSKSCGYHGVPSLCCFHHHPPYLLCFLHLLSLSLYLVVKFY